MTRFTSEQFTQILRAQETVEYGADEPDHEQSVILAALRIAARVTKPGWIIDISPISSGEERQFDEAIQAFLERVMS